MPWRQRWNCSIVPDSRHVASIRAKLDAPSRSAVAAIAVRDHLV